MVPYQMNMARGHVISPETRIRWRRWLTVYFLLVLAVLSVSVGFLTRDWVVLRHQKERIDMMERQFLGQRPGGSSMADAMQRLSRDIAACETQLSALDEFSRGESHAGPIVLGLVRVMPPGMTLGQVTIDRQASKLGIDACVPAGRSSDDSMTPPRLIALWGGEPLLAGKVSQLTSEKSERVQAGGQDVMCWRFTGMLRGGD